ncbi:hypothetical protein GWE18_21855 [Bradyrhizobium sp. CSA112]|uniref:hypothetical protein n=1 Tax=Bradyrhizobium sp. CSA112 TaxID=2699170 RepID=UPI0023B1E311|nr:hypothetical protein [Bradyrhizobium sp. CSA112]MDE5455433.1 hypothetical protein [Bradyrhizobium sp. CSA112]
MIDQLEFELRATLCRQLAKREPANRIYWIAEAESWSRLSKERSGGAAEEKSIPASRRVDGRSRLGSLNPGVVGDRAIRDPTIPATDIARLPS